VEVIAACDQHRHRLANRMTAQRSLDLGIGMHPLAVDRDNPIPSLEAGFGQLAARPGWHAQNEPLTLKFRLAPIPPDRVDAVPRAPTGTDAACGTNAATRQALRK